MIIWKDRTSLPGYSLWRAARARLQEERYRRFVVEAPQDGDESSRIRVDIAALGRGRVRPSARPGIAAFGARDWEENSLWPALASVGDFSLFDYGRRAREARGPSEALRRSLEREFLTEVDARSAVGRAVEIAFFYCSGWFVSGELLDGLNRRGIWTIAMGLDDKQQVGGMSPIPGDRWQDALIKRCDIYWTTWRGAVSWMRRLGGRPWFRPPGAQPVKVDEGGQRRVDVLWLGKLYGDRRGLLQYLSSNGVQIEAWGPGTHRGAAEASEIPKLIANSHVVLGAGGVGQSARVQHLKGRDFEIPMARALYLTSYNSELADCFHIGREVLCYANKLDCLETVRWILGEPARAEAIRTAARERSLRDHTWTGRFLELMELVRGA